MNLKDLKALAERARTLVRDLGDAVREPRNHARWYRIANAEDAERAEMFIYGVIGDDWDPDDVTAASFTRALRGITAPVIDLHINSPGGMVWDGIAIYSALRNHPASVNVTVDGIAASAASFVAMAGNEVAIEKPAKMMIHDARLVTVGDAADHQATVDLLNEVSDTIAQIYADRAGGTAEEWRTAMRAETWFSAEQAVAEGLADRVIGAETNTTSTPVNGRGSHKVPVWNRLDNRGARGMNIEEIMAALKAIIDDAEGRPLTDEEVKRYEALEVDLANTRTAAVKARMHAYESPAPSDLQNVVHVAPKREDDGLEKAFGHYMRTGLPNADIADLRVTNAQGVGTDGAGGFTVPDTMRTRLQERLKAFGGLATAVEEITTAAGETLRWPTLDDTANSGVIAAEGTAPASGGADLVFGEKTLGAFRYVAPGAGNLPLRVSLELLQDSAFDIEGLVERKLGERIARAQAAHWVSGAGTTVPFGINTGTSGTAFTSAGITYAELVAAVHEVDPSYRMSASWTFNDATLAKIESIVDTTGRPILNDANDGIATGPNNRTLLGYPVVVDQAWATYTDGGTNKWGAFGDLRAGYVIRRVQDMTLIVNPYSRASEGQIEYVLWARADGVPQDTNAYRVLINAV